MGASALVWGTHWYTYPSEAQRPWIEARDFKEKGGFWGVIHGYKVHTAKGKPWGDIEASPLRGFILGCSLSCLILLGLFAILVGFGIGYRFAQNISVWVYSGSLIVVITILFPDLFVKFARLPGRVVDLPGDAPLSLMWWGSLTSLYGTVVILKYTRTFDIVEYILTENILPSFKNVGILGLPFVWFLTIATLSPILLSDLSVPRATWYVFWTSWGIGAATCFILGLFLL